MALRDDINYAMMSEIQRFREELLTKEEQDQIIKDVMAFCIIEIRKFCGEDIFEQKMEELKEAKGIDLKKPRIRFELGEENGKKKSGSVQ